ncbi:MAG: hypothetical protein JWP02_1723 [Acidimicrobiales bacterium]|nr:hypothetical protein [Acidimicrobiales bacterium]
MAVVLLLMGTACGQPAMTSQDARTFARRALTSIGFTSVSVSPEVTRAAYRSPDKRFSNQKPVQVWRTHSTVPDGTIELYIPRTGNSAVFVRDEATAGGPLLSDRQFRQLRDFRMNPAADRRRDRLQGPTIAAVLLAVVVACALFFAYFFGRTDRIRWPGTGTGDDPGTSDDTGTDDDTGAGTGDEEPEAPGPIAEEAERQPEPVT